MTPPVPSPGRHDNVPDAAHDAMIGSLGEALAGVNIGSNRVGNNGFSFHSEHDSGSPFPLSSQATAGRELG